MRILDLEIFKIKIKFANKWNYILNYFKIIGVDLVTGIKKKKKKKTEIFNDFNYINCINWLIRFYFSYS